jgi:hypothetical protein
MIVTAAGPQLPEDIHDTETIVRAVKTPHHVNKSQTRIRPAAFRPQVGQSVLSVMRQTMGDDFCKDKGVAICGHDYVGLATITAIEIRRRSSRVFDYRLDFLGHAHIDHELPPIQRGEPPPSDLLAIYDERCESLAKGAVFHKDPAPGVPSWAGEPLKLVSRIDERPLPPNQL